MTDETITNAVPTAGGDSLPGSILPAAAQAPTLAPALDTNRSLVNATRPNDGAMGLTFAQSQEMAAELIKAGMSPERVQAALQGEAEARGEVFAPPTDDRTPEQKEFDASFGAPPPNAYRIDYMGRLPAGTPSDELAEFNAVATGWCSAVGFPDTIGAAFVERAIDVGQSLNRASGAERGLWGAEQAVLFERMAGGPQQAKEKIALAADALERAPAQFTDALRASGALSDAGIMMHLAHQGQRLATRA